VPFIYVSDGDRGATLRSGGKICDVAPTMLELLGLPQPAEVTGKSLLYIDPIVADFPNIDGFRIIEEVGAGSVSSVFCAIEESIGRRVAIKLLRPTAPHIALAGELEREARVLAKLSIPTFARSIGSRRAQSGCTQSWNLSMDSLSPHFFKRRESGSRVRDGDRCRIGNALAYVHGRASCTAT